VPYLVNAEVAAPPETISETAVPPGREELHAGAAGKSYAYAVLSAALAAAMRLVLDRFFGYHHPYTAFYIAVLWSAWYGGVGPALVTVGLGCMAAYQFAQPHSFLAGQGSGGLVGFEFYIAVSLTAVILFEAQRRAERTAAANALVARQRLDRLETEMAQRKRAEEAAGQAEEQLRLTFEHAPAGICKIALDGSLIEANPQFGAILGYARHELLDGDFRKILDQPELRIPSYMREARYVRKDGTEIWIELDMNLVRNSAGVPEFAIGVLQEITARKKSEERLREAQKLESIGLLAGGIAHDFNNLLTGVLGNASLAIDSIPPNSNARRMLEGVMTAAERAADLTAQLLAYAGKGRLLSGDVDLSKLAGAGIELARASIPATVAVQAQLATDLPRLVADASQIQQVVTNLVMNAAESIADNQAGKIVVSTGLLRLDGEHFPTSAIGEVTAGEYLSLRVQDTGSGIDPAILDRIFDPFFTTKFMGRGLGLAAVSGIVRTLKGAVMVSSVLGKGSTFTVLFPPGARGRGLEAEDRAAGKRPATVTFGSCALRG